MWVKNVNNPRVPQGSSGFTLHRQRWLFRLCPQDCQDSLQNSEPEIKFALDYGEHLVDDDLTDPKEKQKIQEDVVEMERTLKDLKEDTAKETIRYFSRFQWLYQVLYKVRKILKLQSGIDITI